MYSDESDAACTYGGVSKIYPKRPHYAQHIEPNETPQTEIITSFKALRHSFQVNLHLRVVLSLLLGAIPPLSTVVSPLIDLFFYM